jgi:hypothetical protein
MTTNQLVHAGRAALRTTHAKHGVRQMPREFQTGSYVTNFCPARLRVANHHMDTGLIAYRFTGSVLINAF